MSKDVMREPKSKSYLDSLRAVDASITEPTSPERADETEDEVTAPPAVTVAEERRAPARQGKGADLQALRAMLPKKETPVQQPVRIPPALKEDLNLLCFALGKTKNEFIAEAVQKEVAREKKRLGLE
jgi:hypothetical protein